MHFNNDGFAMNFVSDVWKLLEKLFSLLQIFINYWYIIYDANQKTVCDLFYKLNPKRIPCIIYDITW